MCLRCQSSPFSSLYMCVFTCVWVCAQLRLNCNQAHLSPVLITCQLIYRGSVSARLHISQLPVSWWYTAAQPSTLNLPPLPRTGWCRLCSDLATVKLGAVSVPSIIILVRCRQDDILLRHRHGAFKISTLQPASINHHLIDAVRSFHPVPLHTKKCHVSLCTTSTDTNTKKHRLERNNSAIRHAFV